MLIQFMKVSLKGSEGDFNNAEQLNKYITIPSMNDWMIPNSREFAIVQDYPLIILQF